MIGLSRYQYYLETLEVFDRMLLAYKAPEINLSTREARCVNGLRLQHIIAKGLRLAK
jgi:hypothetical protein